MTQTNSAQQDEVQRAKLAAFRDGQPTDNPTSDDSIVLFEGALCRWGDMMLRDRAAYWMGGYAF